MQHRGATPSTGTSTLYAYAWTHKAQQTGADGMTSAQKKPTQRKKHTNISSNLNKF